MKGTKTILVFFLLFGMVQCKRDNKVEPISNLLENGIYGISLDDQEGTVSHLNYYLKDNLFYVQYWDTICFGRKAGQVIINENGTLDLTTFQIHNTTSQNPCYFRNDAYGGDTMILHFSNMSEFTDQNKKKALRGDFFILMYKNYPRTELKGKFELGFIRYQ